MADDLLTAFSLLPQTYATALRLRLGGATPSEVGEALDLEPSAVPALLAVADAKLRALLVAGGVSATAGANETVR